MASRTPPNGSRGRPRLTRSDWSMAHIRSERTIDTSSMTRNFRRRISAAVAAAADVVGPDQARRKAEEGMDGLAADVDGGEPGGRQHDHLVGQQVLEAAQQRRLAGAGAAGDEQVALALAQVVVGGQVLRRWARRRPASHRRVGRAAAVGAGEVATAGGIRQCDRRGRLYATRGGGEACMAMTRPWCNCPGPMIAHPRARWRARSSLCEARGDGHQSPRPPATSSSRPVQ